MEIEMHICSFQNPFSLFCLFLTECLRILFLFTVTASFIREKPMPIFFSKQFSLDSFNSKSGGLWFNKSVNNAKGTIMPGPGPEDFIFQHPLKPEGGPEGDKKIPIMSFLSVNYLPKYPKIDVKISITLGTLAAGLQFPAPS